METQALLCIFLLFSQVTEFTLPMPLALLTPGKLIIANGPFLWWTETSPAASLGPCHLWPPLSALHARAGDQPQHLLMGSRGDFGEETSHLGRCPWLSGKHLGNDTTARFLCLRECPRWGQPPPPPHCHPTEQGKKLRLRHGERLAWVPIKSWWQSWDLNSNLLASCYSKYGPWTSSSNSWELGGNVEYQAPPQIFRTREGTALGDWGTRSAFWSIHLESPDSPWSLSHWRKTWWCKFSLLRCSKDSTPTLTPSEDEAAGQTRVTHVNTRSARVIASSIVTSQPLLCLSPSPGH